MTNVEQVIAEGQAQICARVLGRDVTRAELSAAFDRVADKANWKKAIDARIPIGSDFDLLLVREAVIFFTGSVPEIVPVMSRRPRQLVYRVRAVGYYQAVGP